MCRTLTVLLVTRLPFQKARENSGVQVSKVTPAARPCGRTSELVSRQPFAGPHARPHWLLYYHSVYSTFLSGPYTLGCADAAYSPKSGGYSFSREHVTLDKVQKLMSTTIGTDFKGVSEERIGGKQRKAPISPRNTSIAMAGLELDGPISSPPRARWRGESKAQ
ncbi:hypothetical protein CABS01_08578 [Colletotrichum abscissum]|uniref:uncharacterized protein n=1 Tax=Colletotrichum abscissum TaxID=1671311 RepID=UPI0027D5D1D6|nr:uncharacterized protein CABS01_08578 [Colletotrichum abscissum]KAK1507398.1 hypothetical protein CABS01_08578 [Colletotrichum abscissum]